MLKLLARGINPFEIFYKRLRRSFKIAQRAGLINDNQTYFASPTRLFFGIFFRENICFMRILNGNSRLR